MAKGAATSVKPKGSLAQKLVEKNQVKGTTKDVKKKVLEMALLANATGKKKNGKSPNQRKIEAFVKTENKKNEKDAKKAQALRAIEDMKRAKDVQKELDAAVEKEKRKEPKQNKTSKDGKGMASKEAKTDSKSKIKGTGEERDGKGVEVTKPIKKTVVEFRNEKANNKDKPETCQKEKKEASQSKSKDKAVSPPEPPAKRVRQKSPASSVMTDASSDQYKMKRAKAEKAMQQELDSAFVVAAARAEADGHDISKFLEDLDVDVASVGSEARRQVAGEMESEAEEDESSDSSEHAQDEESNVRA